MQEISSFLFVLIPTTYDGGEQISRANSHQRPGFRSVSGDIGITVFHGGCA